MDVCMNDRGIDLRLGALLATLVGLGCGTAPAPQLAPESPAVPDVAALPSDAYAVADLDLQRLRQSASLWAVLTRDQAKWGGRASPCLTEHARESAVALRAVSDDPVYAVAVFRGVDVSAARACLTALPATDAARPPATSPGRGRCQALDDAARDLFRCDELPASLREELKRAQAALATAQTSGDVDAACDRAAEVTRRAVERRTTLAWGCAAPSASDASPSAAPTLVELAPDTLLLDERELVSLSPTTGVAVLLLARPGGDARARLERAFAERKTAASQPAWFAAGRAQRRHLTSDSAMELALSSAYLHRTTTSATAAPRASAARAQLDQRIFASFSPESSALSLRAHHVDHVLALQAATQLSKLIPSYPLLPSFLEAHCEPASLSGPLAERCYQTTRRAFAEKSLAPGDDILEDLLLEGFASLCVETPWSEEALRCLDKAQTDEETNACGKHFDYSSIPLCGSRALAATFQLPPGLLEAAQLRRLRAATWREDCRAADQRLPDALAVGPNGDDPSLTNVSIGYAGQAGAWNLDPYASVAHPDARWEKSKRLRYDLRQLNCLGTLEATAPSFAWRNSSGPCVGEDQSARSPAMVRGSARRPQLLLTMGPGALRVCRADPAAAPAAGAETCAQVPLPSGVQRLSLSEDGARLAVVVSARGRNRVETWDVRASRRVASFPATASVPGACLRAQALGPSILLGDVGCDGEELGTGGRLVSLAGKTIAPLGGDRAFAASLDQPLPLQGPLWAFVAERGDSVVVQNIVTGAVTRRVPTGPPVEAGSFLAASDGAGHFVIAYGAGPRSGSVAFGEASSDAARLFEHSVCPQ